MVFFPLEEWNRWIFVHRSDGKNKTPAVPSVLEICECTKAFSPLMASWVRIRSGYYPRNFYDVSGIVPSLLHNCTHKSMISMLGAGYRF